MSYQKRITTKVNFLLKKKGSCSTSVYKHHSIYSGYLKKYTQPYPFSISETNSGSIDFHSGSIVLAIKTSNKVNNLPGILALKDFFRKRLNRDPSVDELGEFIAIFTIEHHNATVNIKRVDALNAARTASIASMNASLSVLSLLDRVETDISQAIKTEKETKKAIEEIEEIEKSNTIIGGSADGDDDWESLC